MGRRLNLCCMCISVSVTLLTTILVAVAVLTNYWEVVQYSTDEVSKLMSYNATVMAEKTRVLFNGKVIIVNGNSSTSSLISSSSDGDFEGDILVQMHGGLWWLCFDLTDDELATLDSMYPNATGKEKCLDQLKEQEVYIKSSSGRHGVIRQIRMQNLAISCSVVCLIILVACLLVLWVGLIERQVPPVLVVSVLYVLAALFAMFSLSIARYRRGQHPSSSSLSVAPEDLFPCCGALDRRVSPHLLPSRTFLPSWSVYLGWAGVACCCLSAICVYVLSKVMRNGPFLLC